MTLDVARSLSDAQLHRVQWDDDIFTRFGRTYRPALLTFARLIADWDASLVVAISRKAPRLLNFINASAELPAVAMERCITEKALPFLPADMLDGHRVLLVDDTLIWGSTFASIAHRLSDAGAQIDELVLARSRSASPEMLRRVEAAATLTESEIHAFIDLEIQAFGSLAIPYDVDHPIVNLPLASPDAALAALRLRYPQTVETTRRWQRAHGVRVFSVPVGARPHAPHSQRQRQYGPEKLRLFVNERTGDVKAVAIFCLAIRDEDLNDDALFASASAGLSNGWIRLRQAVSLSKYNTEDKLRALAYGAHYLAGVELAQGWVHANSDLLADRPTVAEQDLRLLFGPLLASELADAVDGLLAGASQSGPPGSAAGDGPATAMSTSPLDAFAEVAALAQDAKGVALMTMLSRYLHATAEDDVGARLSALFEAQRRVFDDATRDRERIDESRLDVGIPFAVIPDLLRTAGPIPEEDFDFWCDTAVDGGTIVPKYARALSDPGV